MLRFALVALTLAFSSCGQPAKSTVNKVSQEASLDTVFKIQQEVKRLI